MYQSGDIRLQKANLYADIMTIVMLVLGVYIFVSLNVVVGLLVVLITAFHLLFQKAVQNSVSQTSNICLV